MLEVTVSVRVTARDGAPAARWQRHCADLNEACGAEACGLGRAHTSEVCALPSAL